MGARLGWLLAAVVTTSVSGAELPKTDGWVEVRTTHFTLYGSAGAKDTKRIGIELERFREALGRITKGFELPAEIPTSFYVFRNDAQFAPYKLDREGRPQNIGGFFAERPFRNYVTVDASAMSGMHVAYHEYVHAVLHRTLPRVPSWLNEGLAEFYGTFRFNVLSNDAEVGSVIEGRVRTLAEHGMMPIPELFSTTASHKAGDSSSLVFYAQSWLLVHYLITDDARRVRLSRLLSMLRDGREPDEAVAEALEAEPAALLEELERYFKTGGGRFKIKFDDPIAKQAVESRDMAPGEVLYRLGDLLGELGTWNADAARAHLEAALAQGGPRASIHAALGAVAEKREEHEEAARQYRLATEAEGADAEVYARRGRFTLHRFFAGQPISSEEEDAPPAVLEARALLAKSIELDPGGVEALAILGLTYRFGGAEAAKEGIPVLERASALRPDRLDVLADLACLLAQAGRTGDAWTLVKTRLAPRAKDDPGYVDQAESGILRTEWRRVNELVGGGAVERAIELLAELEGKLESDGLRKDVAEYRSQLLQDAARRESGVAQAPTAAPMSGFVVMESDEAERVKRTVDAYNRAVSLMNAGDEDGALALLDSTLETCPKGELCDQLRAQADELRALAAHNRTVSGVNQAIGLINDGKRKEGIERLRELERACKDPALAERIRGLLEELGAREP